MSELKARTAQEIVRNEKDCDYMDELFGGVKMPPTQVYLKSEADKVIADLIEKNKRLAHKDAIMASETIKDLFKELRHHKYKRCLDKVKQCTSMMNFNSKYGTDKKWHLFKKWRERWLELAEKFKEAK